jgi:hypothetical protein
MSLFCLLWIPLFYFFRRSISGESGGGVWALLLGSLMAVFQFFLGNLVNPGGFGFSRWLSGFVDIVSLPVLVPLAVYALLVLFRAFSGSPDFANFILLWFIPVSVLRAVSWSALNDPLLLVVTPLLWTALAVGIPFFIGLLIRHSRWYSFLLSLLCIPALPLAAAAAYWALFSQQPRLGYPLLGAVLLPLIAATVLDFLREK